MCVCFSVFFRERNFLSIFLWAFRETSLQLSEILHFLKLCCGREVDARKQMGSGPNYTVPYSVVPCS